MSQLVEISGEDIGSYPGQARGGSVPGRVGILEPGPSSSSRYRVVGRPSNMARPCAWSRSDPDQIFCTTTSPGESGAIEALRSSW